MAVTLAIYYVTPWLSWDRGPFAPDQAVLINLDARRFYFAFIEIWPQEFYYVAGLLVMAGRRAVPHHLDGRARLVRLCLPANGLGRPVPCRRARHRGRPQPAHQARQGALDGLDKLAKRVLKHGIWLLIGVATGGAWIFYFADAPTLLRPGHHLPGAGDRLCTIGF